MLEVIEPGALTTVQDRGRIGWARYGIPESGPMDRLAFAAANRLVGNGSEVAALEITLSGPYLRTTADTLIAVCGADFDLWVDRVAAPGWHSVFARAGSFIRFGQLQAGARAYFAVAGGIVVPSFLGSGSTYLPGGFGGLGGRALRIGDRLETGNDPLGRSPHQLWSDAGQRWPKARRPDYSDHPELRILLGPQEGYFAAEVVQSFLAAAYVVSPESDRMGSRLAGLVVRHRGPTGIVSDGVIAGTIQIPPDGRPIVMMVDHQTTGGYPKIGTVIQADLPLLAQCLPGDTVRFRAVTLAEARAASTTFLMCL
jgi:antagonist of KipI